MDWPKLPPCPYLNFLGPDDVRVRGSRIDLSLVIDEYYKGHDPEDMVREYPPLDLESVYGVLTYYMGHRELVDRYVACVHQRAEENYQAYLAKPPAPVVERLRFLLQSKKSA